MYNIEIYKDRNGKSEIKEYIKKLNSQNTKDNHIKLNKIISYIRELKKRGITLGSNYVKHIEGEIWELRPLRDRILFAYLENNTFILLCYFIKRTQKTPKNEIKKAKRLLKDYRDRRNYNER